MTVPKRRKIYLMLEMCSGEASKMMKLILSAAAILLFTRSGMAMHRAYLVISSSS